MVATVTKPTICHLLHSLCVGGAEVLAARLARWFSPRYRIVFACLDSLGSLGDELRREGFRTHVLERRPGFDWRCVGRLARLLRDERVDIVHSHQYTPFIYSMFGRRLTRRPAILFTEHGRPFPDMRRPKRVFANRLLLERRDRVVGVGEAVRQALIANEGIPAKRVNVVLNGVDLTRFAQANDEATAVRREIGLGDNDLVILQVARLDYLKDHPTALRAMKRVTQSLPHARLVLAGDGPQRADVERQVAELGLADKVRILGTRRDVGRLLAAADMFLLSSISEGIPLTLIEAMAAGVPVVSTDVGGVGEVVQHGINGLLAPARNDAALSDGIISLGKNAGLRRQMGQAGIRRANGSFAEGHMHESYGRLYAEMCHA